MTSKHIQLLPAPVFISNTTKTISSSSFCKLRHIYTFYLAFRHVTCHRV